MKKSFWVLSAIVLVGIGSYAFTSKSGDPVYKNLKILPQNITEKQLDSVMHHFTASLNVKCNFCHVRNDSTQKMDWASDLNKHKGVAREMMTMTNKINDDWFPYGGKAADMTTNLTVTCFSCHNGRKEPLVNPPAEERRTAPPFPGAGGGSGLIRDTVRKQ